MTWNIKLLKDNPLYPALVIDNWYTPNEEKAVWKELDFYSATPKKYLEKAEDTIVARDKDGSPRSTAYRFYLETFYFLFYQYLTHIFLSMHLRVLVVVQYQLYYCTR